MIAILWSLALLAMVHATPAATDADEPVLLFADRYDDAFEEAKLRNVPVVILDFDGWSDEGGDKISDFYTHKGLLKAFESAVLVIASQENHDQIVQKVRGTERQVCALYGAVPCATHLRMLPKIFTDYAEDGQLKSPLFLVALPDGTLKKRMVEEISPSELERPLKKVQEEMGKGLSTPDFVMLTEGLDRAERWIRLGEWKPAVEGLEELGKHKGESPLHERIADRRHDVHAKGNERFEKASAAWDEGRHRESLWAIDALAFEYGKTEVGRKATSWTKQKLKTDEGKPHSKELSGHRKARELYTEGVLLDDAGESKKALSVLKRLLRSYPDSLWALKAQSLVDLLEEGGCPSP